MDEAITSIIPMGTTLFGGVAAASCVLRIILFFALVSSLMI
jgi:hypothetical protein